MVHNEISHHNKKHLWKNDYILNHFCFVYQTNSNLTILTFKNKKNDRYILTLTNKLIFKVTRTQRRLIVSDICRSK